MKNKKLKIKHKCWFIMGIFDALLSCTKLIMSYLNKRTDTLFDVMMLFLFSIFFFVRAYTFDQIAEYFGWKED